MILMAICLTVPATVNAQSKAVKKEVKAKLKEYKKKGFEVFGTSRTLEAVLTKHYQTLEEKDGQVFEVFGTSTARSRNVAASAAQNSAANRYATNASAQIKGRMLADMASNASNPDEEFDKFYSVYEGKVEQEIRGELRPSFSVAHQNEDGTILVEAYYLVDEEAASRARIKAFEISKNESEAAQKYAQKVSDFVNERVQPEN